ncbi:Sesquipedalian-1 [Hondaea fermentalgiana]|uniref:Sesquipedalian-1 n=1 Tax=Hondaea fermentalgiana TaxID=2315210 RepID=A0A2R5G324_9STRA|nr:Sesquipedalian-1 [Hondaea fermentalgiana]|eukprot:GBG25412.1 Sesquipedalian-1 [Hondaea fermentalgiana]
MLAPEDAQRLPDALPEDGHNGKSGILMKRGLRYQSVPCFGTEFKRRYVVLRGKYMYRFKSENHKRVKGVPLDLEEFQLEVADYEVDDDGEVLPFAFKLSSVRKVYLFAASSARERQAWLQALAAARSHAIKQRLGHAERQAWETRNNNLGASLQRQHDRMRDLQRQEDQARLAF